MPSAKERAMKEFLKSRDLWIEFVEFAKEEWGLYKDEESEDVVKDIERLDDIPQDHEDILEHYE